MLTKKDMEILAREIREVSEGPVSADDIVEAVCRAIGSINPRFNRERFLSACDPDFEED